MQPAGLEHQRAAEVVRVALDDLGIALGMGRRLVVLAIGNAQPAAEIDMVDRDGRRPRSSRDEVGQQREGVVEGLQVRDLAADMHVDAGHRDARQRRGARIDGPGLRDRDAELVLRLAGRDLVVRLGVDVRD